jgi:3-methyl-2-oxobutanoate hydroxymethyltransferase
VRSVLDFDRAKCHGNKIVLVAAYDALAARLLAAAEVDAILVGDSVAMVVHGHPSTVHATLGMMQLHTAAVRRGAPDAFIVADMPFLTARLGRREAVEAAGSLVQAGASAVKIEGVTGHEETLAHVIESGIPVMGHLGLTPQSIHQFGGHRFQGRTSSQAARLRTEATTLAAVGAFAAVLECIPAALAAEITASIAIPTIGIGAGSATDGQVLVLSDVLGLDHEFRPRFARQYASGYDTSLAAVNAFARDVRAGAFPAPQEVLV